MFVGIQIGKKRLKDAAFHLSLCFICYQICSLAVLGVSAGKVDWDSMEIVPEIPGMNFAADDTDGKRLFRDLFLRYLKAERPVKNTSQAVEVTMDPVLINLLSIEEVDEAITMNFWNRLYWTDEQLQWNASEYGGRAEIHVPQDMVWKPDVIIYNNLRLVDHVKEDVLYVKVRSDGYVQYLYPAIFEVSCDLDIKYFPFDMQNCSLKFGSWSFHGFALNLFRKRLDPPLDQYKENPEWDLVNAKVIRHNVMYTCCPEPYPDVTFSVLLKRKPLFYIITLVCPATIITTVSIVGLFSPSYADGEREEKVTMGMTTLLTMSVLLMMVADQMPRTSKVIPIIGLFYMFQLFVSACGTVTTVAIMNLEKEGHYGHKPPRWAVDFFSEILPYYLGMDWRPKHIRRKITNVHWINEGQTVLPEKVLNKVLEGDPTRATLMLHIEAEILRTLKEIHARTLKIDDRHVVMNDWDRICDTIDRLCMIIYLIIFAGGSIIIFAGL